MQKFWKAAFKCFRFFLHFKQSEARIINDLLLTVGIYEIKGYSQQENKTGKTLAQNWNTGPWKYIKQVKWIKYVYIILIDLLI